MLTLLTTPAAAAAAATCHRSVGVASCSQRSTVHAQQLRIGRSLATLGSHAVRRRRCTSAGNGAMEPLPEPEDARGAIALGLRVFEGGQYEAALELFGRALTLPGTGTKRFRDKPPALSDGEKQACYFNMACCYGKVGNVREGLVAVAGCLEAGYADFRQLRGDADLAPLREDAKFEGLLARFEKKPSALGKLFEGFM